MKVSRQVSIEKEQFEKINKLKKKLGVTFSGFTRAALNDYIKKIEK